MLVFDSTIWPSGGNELEGTIKNTSSLSQKPQKQQNQQHQQQQQRTTSQAVLKEQQRRRRQQKQHEQPRQHHSQLNDNHINNNHDKTNNHIDNDTKRGRKNKSPSIDKSFKQNGPSTSSSYHNNHNNGNILNHKTNNIRNNDCQAKRIQLSSAAKRCKNINRSIVDNNNPNPINDICSYDVEINIPTVSNYQLENLSYTFNSSANDGNTSNTPPPPSTPDSPTLVKVKTWYTQAVAKQGVIFWYWNHLLLSLVLHFVWYITVQENNIKQSIIDIQLKICFMFSGNVHNKIFNTRIRRTVFIFVI